MANVQTNVRPMAPIATHDTGVNVPNSHLGASNDAAW